MGLGCRKGLLRRRLLIVCIGISSGQYALPPTHPPLTLRHLSIHLPIWTIQQQKGKDSNTPTISFSNLQQKERKGMSPPRLERGSPTISARLCAIGHLWRRRNLDSTTVRGFHLAKIIGSGCVLVAQPDGFEIQLAEAQTVSQPCSFAR